MIIVFVISFGLILLLLFSNGKSNVSNETGELVQTKYAELINNINGNSPTPQIFNSTINAFSYGWITPNADNRIHLNQKSGYLQIKWIFKARIVWLNKLINLSKEWHFSDNGNAEEMANKIKVEMSEALDGAGI